MKKRLFIGVIVIALIVVGAALWKGGIPTHDLQVVVGDTAADVIAGKESTTPALAEYSAASSEGTTSSSSDGIHREGEVAGVTTNAPQVIGRTATPTVSPKATASSTSSIPTTTSTGTNSGGSSGAGGSGSGSSSTNSSSGSGEVVGANNVLSVKGTGTIFKLVTNGKPGLTVKFSSTATVEVKMSNLSFTINVISAPSLPLTYTFATSPGRVNYVFENSIQRYALETVPSSGIVEKTVTSVPTLYEFGAGYKPSTWNIKSPDPVNLSPKFPPKNDDDDIVIFLYWLYDLAADYRSANGTLVGICDRKGKMYVATADAVNSGKNYQCNATPNSVVITVQLPISGLYTCFDDKGNKIGSTSTFSGGTSCK